MQPVLGREICAGTAKGEVWELTLEERDKRDRAPRRALDLQVRQQALNKCSTVSAHKLHVQGSPLASFAARLAAVDATCRAHTAGFPARGTTTSAAAAVQETGEPVRGLTQQALPGGRLLVLVTTPSRLYSFAGPGPAKTLFAEYPADASGAPSTLVQVMCRTGTARTCP